MTTKTVLFVEDQIEFLAVHKMYLEKHGYRVVAVGDGWEAVQTARTERPQVILMDLSIPGIDGLTATRELKNDPDTSEIPVIMMTAHGYGAAGRRAKEAGCTGFIAKPVDPNRVLAEVQRLIGPATAPN